MAQATLRIAGRANETKTFVEGSTTITQLVGQPQGVFRVNGTPIQNPANYQVPDGALVEWTEAPKSARIRG